jgi:hypothetical protein
MSRVRIAENFELDIQGHLIERGVSILGMRGSGKSYTTGVICEQLLEAGQPIIVIDLMGEYYTLRERYPILIAALGDPEYADLKGLSPETARRLAEFVVESGLSLVLDLKFGRMIDRFRLLASFLEALYHAEEKAKRPYVLVMDEGHRITPEKGVIRLKAIRDAQSEVEAWTYEIGATGRHYGLGFIVVARRSAEISKMILAQTEIRILHKLVDPTDLSYASNWLRKEQVEKVRNFGKGEAVVVGLEEPIFLKVRRRLCSHGGGTPLSRPVETPDLSEAIERLSELLEAPAPMPPPAAPSETLEKVRRLEMERGEFEERMRGLEAELSEAHARIKSLEALSEERLKRIRELEARLPEAEELEEMKRSYMERVRGLEMELEKVKAERDELHSQLLEASEDLGRLEEVRGLLLDWRDIIVELGRKLGVELIPSDIQAIIDDRDRYRRLYEELTEEIERRKRLTEDVLKDPAIQDWIKTAKATLRWFLERRSEHGKILRKVIVTDPTYLLLPEEFPEVRVSPSTVASYLNDFTLKGFVLKHEKAKQGRTAYSNALPLWVSENVRRIRLDAPDDAIEHIVEQLKNYVLAT